ncbi:MAG: DUF2911 domain-containing protein [Blastocatellia bacterium]
MKRTLLPLTLILCFASALQAQDKKPTVVFNEPVLGERGTSRILYWNQDKNEAAGEFTINFGRPVWKKQYENEALFGIATKGKLWRLGNDYFTVLDTNVPLKISGKDIPVGLWYLALYRSEDGGMWSLAFIDPVKARQTRLDPFAINKATVEFKVPITVDTGAAEMKDKLTISLTPEKENIKNVTLKIAWGKLQLTAPVQVSLE